MKDIKLNISEDEANLILNALGAQPYIKVAALIKKLQQQAANEVLVNVNHTTVEKAEQT